MYVYVYKGYAHTSCIQSICFISLHVDFYKLKYYFKMCTRTHLVLRACYNIHVLIISSIVCSVIDYNLKLLQYKSNKNHQKVFLKIKPP